MGSKEVKMSMVITNEAENVYGGNTNMFTSCCISSNLIGDGSDQRKIFKPYQTLSRFIDSIPMKTYKEGESVPPLATKGSKYKKMAEGLSALLANIPGSFSKPLKFFWNQELELVKINGEEVMVGAGRLGNVFLGFNHKKEWFALKYFNILKRKDYNALAAILKEALLQDKLAQQHAAPTFQGIGFIMNNSRYHRLILISSFIPAKPNCMKSLTLSALCTEDSARRRNGNFPVLFSHQYLDLLEQIAAKMATLAECQVVHTDIKFDNMLLQVSDDGQQLRPYLIDFGSGFAFGTVRGPLFKHDTRMEAEFFLKRYRQFAPEFLFDPDAISNKSDLYGLGLILRGIGIYLEIPALVCVASRLRLRNPGNRPDGSNLPSMIKSAFGKNPFEHSSRIKRNALSKTLVTHSGDANGDNIKHPSNVFHQFASDSIKNSTASSDKQSGVESCDGNNDSSPLYKILASLREVAEELCEQDNWKNLVFQKSEIIIESGGK